MLVKGDPADSYIRTKKWRGYEWLTKSNVRDRHGIVGDYTGDRRVSRLHEFNE